MWECSYANEQADGKLIRLLLIKKIKWIIAVTIIGALLGALVYFLTSQVFAPAPKYEVDGQVYVDYVVTEGYGISMTCYNAETWNTMIKSDEFMDIISDYVVKAGFTVDEDAIRKGMSAALVSDSRMLLTKVVMDDGDLAVAVHHGMVQAIYQFGQSEDVVTEIRIMADPEKAVLEERENRWLSAILTGAVIGFFLSMVAFLIKLAVDDSLYLPDSFQRRYKIPSLGTIESKGLYVDFCSLTEKHKKIGILAIDESIPVDQIEEKLKKLCKENKTECPELFSFSFKEDNLEQTKELKNLDCVILVTGYGRHDGRRIDKFIECLHRRDINIVAGILWEADEKLLTRYYR